MSPVSSLKVSVLLPVRNGEATLECALKSLWQQTFTDFEVVVVDDGSMDATPAILSACKDARLRMIRQAPAGISVALNKGLAHCKAPLVARMDADDEAHPERLEKQFGFLSSHPEVDILACGVNFRGDSKRARGYFLYVEAINKLLTHEQMWMRRFWDAPLAHPSVMFRKEAVLEAGAYSTEALPEDYELWLRLFQLGYRFAKLPEKLLSWYDHEGRLSRTHINYSKKSFWKLKARYFSLYLKQAYGDSPPPIYIWGETKKKSRSQFLLNENINVEGRIGELDHNTTSGVIPYTLVPQLKGAIILVYVSNRIGQAKIISFLPKYGFREGKEFFLMV